MRIHLPNSAFLGNMDPFIRGFNPSEPGRLSITANDKWISVHPAAISMIAALGLTLAPKNIQCQKLEARSRHYFSRIGLLKLLSIDSDISIREHDPTGRFIPLTQIQSSDELTSFITEMIPLLHLDAEAAKTIGYIVSELVRNVIEHAEAPNGALLCAQYYKKSSSIRIGIADTGLGIKATITRSHRADSDLDAIRLALMPGITGATRKEGGTEQNAGAGLFFIKSIASVNRDFFIIYSGTGFYKLLKKNPTRNLRLRADPFQDRHATEAAMPYWQGTVIGIDLTLNQTKDFSLLLDAIRETYGSAVRERRKERYRNARFS